MFDAFLYVQIRYVKLTKNQYKFLRIWFLEKILIPVLFPLINNKLNMLLVREKIFLLNIQRKSIDLIELLVEFTKNLLSKYVPKVL